MQKRLLIFLALIGLAGLSVPAHAQVLKGGKKENTKQAKAKKDAAPAASEAADAAKTKKSTTKTKAVGKGTTKKMNQASPK